jgi:hypothetical protein
VIRDATARSALVFRLARRRYALELNRTSGVGDLGSVRRIPDAPRAWLGLADWGGRVLNVIDLPFLLDDRAVDSVSSLVRLRAPQDDLALFVPAHLGLTEWSPPQGPRGALPYSAAGNTPDALYWIDLDALLQLAAASAPR